MSSIGTRLPWPDIVRGMAVVLMIIFHATYDMNMLGLIKVEMLKGFWWYLPRFIVFLFLFCVGDGLVRSHGQQIRWNSFGKRFLKLAALAALVSLGTWLTFPHLWVYFGTLHCIATVSLMALPFLLWPAPWLRWVVMLTIISLQYGAGYDIKWVNSFIDRKSMDFIPAYPWFWVVLLGMELGPVILSRPLSAKIPPRLLSWPAFLGQHSLKIYLLHQPILFGLLSLWAGNK